MACCARRGRDAPRGASRIATTRTSHRHGATTNERAARSPAWRARTSGAISIGARRPPQLATGPPVSRELYGAAGCPYTRELREQLEWEGAAFVEYDVEVDPEARRRLAAITSGGRIVPVLVEDGRVIAVGWQGRGCTIAPLPGEPR